MKEALMGARITYYAVHVGFNIIFIFYKNEFQNQLINLNLILPSIYIISTILATHFFLNTGKRPGYVSFDIGLTARVKKENEDYTVFDDGEGFEMILEKKVEVEFDEYDEDEEEKSISKIKIVDTY